MVDSKLKSATCIRRLRGSDKKVEEFFEFIIYTTTSFRDRGYILTLHNSIAQILAHHHRYVGSRFDSNIFPYHAMITKCIFSH